MQTAGIAEFEEGLRAGKSKNFPLVGQLDLTYRCGYDCVHCYGKGSENEKAELPAREWKRLLGELREVGCVWLVFSGGDPLIRRDFCELYSHAKKLGFIVNVFTSAHGIAGEHLRLFRELAPFAVEITLYGATASVYEKITRRPGSFARALANIRALQKIGVKLQLKTVCLKENAHEFGRIKALCESITGKPASGLHSFVYDATIFPRLNGDLSPCEHRLSWAELEAMRRQDPEVFQENEQKLKCGLPERPNDPTKLYCCNTWENQVFIDPCGRFKFCMHSDKYSSDLCQVPLKTAFRSMRQGAARARMKTDSKCRACELRGLCFFCPSLARIETGDEEAPVPYFCELAHETARAMRRHARR